MTMFDNTEASVLTWGWGLPTGVGSKGVDPANLDPGRDIADSCVGCGTLTMSRKRICGGCGSTKNNKDPHNFGRASIWVPWLPVALAAANCPRGLSGLYVRLATIVPPHKNTTVPETHSGAVPFNRVGLQRVLAARGLIDMDSLTLITDKVEAYLASGMDRRADSFYSEPMPVTL